MKIKGGAHNSPRLVGIAAGCDNIVHYRPETEICFLFSGIQIRTQTNLQRHVSMYTDTVKAYSLPPIHLITHYL